jgi:Anthrone oxygenase
VILLVLTPRNNPAFWWTVVAFIAVTATHVVFWVITQPVNRYWVSQLKLPNAAQHFFYVDERDQQAKHLQELWKALRNRWEYSHIIRAILAGIGLIALTVAVAIYR